LNQATPEGLQNFPGIGPVLADRIIKFRDGLGGFMKVEQMRDIYGLPPETLEKIMPYLTIMATPQPILINEIDLNNFSNPYISKKMARMIKAYKDQHGSFRNASELRKVYPPDSMWCEKVLPYLRF
jgi:competence ComEA-like helix-hairpin-helix protein